MGSLDRTRFLKSSDAWPMPICRKWVLRPLLSHLSLTRSPQKNSNTQAMEFHEPSGTLSRNESETVDRPYLITRCLISL